MPHPEKHRRRRLPKAGRDAPADVRASDVVLAVTFVALLGLFCLMLLGSLVGAAVAGEAGAAKECSINRSQVTIKDTGERYAGQKVVRPDLVGRTLKIERFTAVRDMQRVASSNTLINLGYEAYELVGAGEVLFVKRERSESAPAIAPISWSLAEAGRERFAVKWWSGRPEKVKVGQTLDYVLDGPLTSLTLEVSACL